MKTRDRVLASKILEFKLNNTCKWLVWFSYVASTPFFAISPLLCSGDINAAVSIILSTLKIFILMLYSIIAILFHENISIPFQTENRFYFCCVIFWFSGNTGPDETCFPVHPTLIPVFYIIVLQFHSPTLLEVLLFNLQ